MKIIVDSREKENVRNWLVKRNVKFTVEALPTGDYLFWDKNVEEKVLVERKTVNDLIGSYKSGRLKDQMIRMSKEKYPMLLITGNVEEVRKYVKIEPNFVQKIMSDAIVKFKFRGVVWMLTESRHADVHKEGLIFLVDMLKSLSLGNMDIVDSVNKRVGKRDIGVKTIVDRKVVPRDKQKCPRCGKKKEVFVFKGTKVWLCQTPRCGGSGAV